MRLWLLPPLTLFGKILRLDRYVIDLSGRAACGFNTDFHGFYCGSVDKQVTVSLTEALRRLSAMIK